MAISKRRPQAPVTSGATTAPAHGDPASKQAFLDAAVSRAVASVGAAPTATPPVGHNAPPKDDSLQAHRDRYAELRQAGEGWLKAEITDQETADLAEGWRRQVGAARKAADAQRIAEKRPHDEAGKAVQAKWLPVIEAFDRLDGPIRQKLTDFARAERDRIAKEQETARRAADEARRDAERAADQAMTAGTFSAHDHAADLARQAEEAEAVAKAAESRKPQVGAGVVVDGRKRAGSLRDKETITVTNNVAALTALMASISSIEIESGTLGGPWDNALDGVAEAIKTLYRAVRKANPEAAAKCPGINIATEERIV